MTNDRLHRSDGPPVVDPAISPMVVGPIIGAAGGMIAVWYALVWSFDLPPIVLPPPHAVGSAMVEHAAALGRATMITAAASVVGLAAAAGLAMMIAVVFDLFPPIGRALFPYVLAMQTVPVVAVAPLLVLWSGYTFRSVVVVVVIVCLFPIVHSVVEGMRRIDPDQEDLLRLYGANRWTMLWRLRLPTAAGEIVTVLKTAAALAVIGAIVAEFFVGNGTSSVGLGYLMTAWQMQNMTDRLIAAIVASAMLGLSLYGGIDLISGWLLRRYLVR